MMDITPMHELRLAVDKRYVGFRPESGSVKPVHIAAGAFRAILVESNSADGIKKLAYVMGVKGKTPKGNEPEAVIQFLLDNNAYDNTEITPKQLADFRGMLQKLIDVDKGVYGSNGMWAFTAGADSFVTEAGQHEYAGEFIGGLIKVHSPLLGEYIEGILRSPDDPISIVFKPVLDKGDKTPYEVKFLNDTEVYRFRHESIEAFEQSNPNVKLFLESLKKSGDCLKSQLDKHPNKLTQLRLFVYFCIFQLVRYMSSLETFYCEGGFRPILLDFSYGRKGSVSQTSGLCYSQLHKSISRFYAWGFAQELYRQGHSKDILMQADVLVYDKPKKDKDGNNIPMNAKTYEELKSMWNIAKVDASDLSEDDARLVFGAAINDMTAVEATSNPVNYLRKLGTEAGLLYPPTNFHTDKRFLLSEDMLEVLLLCCVAPNETVTSTELRSRLFDRLGVIIGGDDKDSSRLNDIGSIVYADTDALAENYEMFTDALQKMNFAEQLPDGIMQIRFGGK
jgi:hypothetical protein